jgi:NAD(P)-dependent dehydrogenase (short-subunit alcohol dehydrogenase family)
MMRVLITGASRGLGQALVGVLSKRGYEVITSHPSMDLTLIVQ